MAKGYGATEWRDDLKRVLKRSGVEGRDCVFLLADTQIVQEGFLEDINNILNAGEGLDGQSLPGLLPGTCCCGCVDRAFDVLWAWGGRGRGASAGA